MSLALHNSLTGQKETFQPIHPGEVRMYVCGPTVYADLHIGNFRTIVAFDTLARYLRHLGYTVKKAQNFTDVDDKTIRRALEEGIPLDELAQRYIDTYHRDAQRLGIADQVEPRATAYIPAIIRFIEGLIAGGHAYAALGSVYFSVPSLADYGALSHRPAEAMLAGARVEPEPGKKDPRDFALWKAALAGEPSWESPWGPGRPGWHIECSVMSEAILGVPFDIHGAGEDLLFPHNENELAQTRALTGEPLARYWLHGGMLAMGGEEMHKSLGNTFSVPAVLERISPAALRLFLLSAHYRSPLTVDDEALEAAETAVRRIANVLRRLRGIAAQGPGTLGGREWEAFHAALDDDFNTAGAQGALFDLVRRANTRADANMRAEEAAGLLTTLEAMLGVLGIDLLAPGEDGGDDDIQELVDRRQEARARRDFAEADAIRAQLASQGVQVEDTPQGPRWFRTARR